MKLAVQKRRDTSKIVNIFIKKFSRIDTFFSQQINWVKKFDPLNDCFKGRPSYHFKA